MNRNNIGAIIQARMGSTRLPGKVLFPILGKPVLLHIVERLRESKYIDKIVIATTVDSSDNQIELFCIENMIPCYRGSVNDVAVRVLNAAERYKIDTIVDITGDCPFVDGKWIDKTIFKEEEAFIPCDYIHNIYPRTWPDGFDVQVYDKKLYEYVVKQLSYKSPYREHSGWNILNYINNNKNKLMDKFLVNSSIKRYEDLSHWGLTLDTEEDYIVIKTIFEHFKDKEYFGFDEIINYVNDNMWILDINKSIKRKEPGS